jgi:hypothetical protein
LTGVLLTTTAVVEVPSLRLSTWTALALLNFVIRPAPRTFVISLAGSRLIWRLAAKLTPPALDPPGDTDCR